MNAIETQARQLWRQEAKSEIRFGVCGRCGRARDDDGKPLLVGWIKRVWTCIACWDQR